MDSILTSIRIAAKVGTPLHECRAFLGSRSHGPQSNGTGDGRVCESGRGRNHAVGNEIIDALSMEEEIDRQSRHEIERPREVGYDSQNKILVCQ